MRGNTASTRARLGLHGYSSTVAYYRDDPDVPAPSTAPGSPCPTRRTRASGDEGEEEEVPEDLIEKVDMGKNVWYHTFDMFSPELVSQGLMLNQPAVYPDDFENPEGFLTEDASLGYNFYTIDPDPDLRDPAGGHRHHALPDRDLPSAEQDHPGLVRRG